MVRDVTLGQYYPGNSLIHRLDPRSKILLLIGNLIIIFCTFNYVSLALVTVFTIFCILLSGISLKTYIKSLKVVLVIVVITSVLNLFYGTGEPIWQWGILRITLNGINRAVFVTIRIICLILISSCLTFTTAPNDLTDAIEKLMKPLNKLHFPVHEIAMMMTLALRFVPTLLEETDKIMQAQKARGADMEAGNLITRVKALIPILIPLFVSAFRRAYEIATAMECRCYNGGSGRTRMKTLHMSGRDAAAFVAVIVIICGVIVCNLMFKAVL